MGVGNRDRLSERRFLVSHRCLIVSAFGGLPMAVPAALGIEELDPVDIDEVPVVLGTRLPVLPGFRALAAFEVDAGAFMEVFANDLCLATKCFHGKPLRVFLQLAILVLPSFGGGDGELRDGRSLFFFFFLWVYA